MRKQMAKMALGVFLTTFHAFGFSGAAQIPYLARLITESAKRHEQLKMLIEQSKNRDQLLKTINQGIDNAVGIIQLSPIEDEGVLEGLETTQERIQAVEKIYGAIPENPESAMLSLHDQSVAESIKIVNDLKKYVSEQEKNSLMISKQATQASPKGAQRMAAVTNSQILHALSQLIRINGQILKLQSEFLATGNKSSKDSASHFNQINSEIDSWLNALPTDVTLPTF